MLEKEIKFIVDFNLNKIRNTGNYFTLDKLSSAGVHPAILKYISAELDLMIYEDRKRLLNSSTFDYSGGEINKLFSMISREIKRNKRISFEDVRQLIFQAASFNANYVVRPRWSLLKLIFDPGTTRTVEEIRLLLEYTYYYDYVKNIIIAYMGKKQATDLSAAEFEEVYSKIDNELFPGNRKLLDNALSSISDFFSEGAAVKAKLPPELVLIFLKEKNLTEYFNRLKQSVPADGKQKYNINEIRSIIYETSPEEIKSTPPQKIKEIPFQKEKPAEELPPEIIAELPDEETTDSKEADYIDIVPDQQSANEDTDLPLSKSANEDTDLPLSDEETVTEEEFIKVESKLPVIGEDTDSEASLPGDKEEDIVSKSEEEIAEEINLPIVEDEIIEPPDEEKTGEEEHEENIPSPDIDIDLDRETKLILPDEEVEELYSEAINKITGEEVESDEDEIKFDLESKDKLDELYEFEEEKEEISGKEESAAYLDLDDKDFNLSELENELKQIEAEFNIQPETGGKKIPPKVKKTSTDDLIRFLTAKEVERIISNIFNEDQDDFMITLERISECENYENATEILKSVFLTYRINPYSRDAVNLTNAVSKYFDMR